MILIVIYLNNSDLRKMYLRVTERVNSVDLELNYA